MRYLLLTLLLSVWAVLANAATTTNTARVPILVYHNFNPTVPGSMSLTPARFEEQLKWLKENDYTVISLQDLVSYLRGEKNALPEKPVVITADDGWESVYTYLVPLAKKYQMPVTLFIYPSTISSGKHAMTWEQLKTLQKTGLFDIQSHTYSHPNFKQEKKHLSPEQYQHFVHRELVNSKKILEEKMGTKITLLAWPFGIYDPYLEQEAANAGYLMAFSIDARPAKSSDRAMAEPRYMIVAGQNMKTFAAIMRTSQNKTASKE